jgi:hypothetical protein
MQLLYLNAVIISIYFLQANLVVPVVPTFVL